MSRGPALGALFLAFCVLLGLASVTQNNSAKAPATASPPPVPATAAAGPPACQTADYAGKTKPPQHGVMAVLPETRWQPYNGEVHLKLSGFAALPTLEKVVFAWRGGDNAACQEAADIRLIAQDKDTYTYAVQVPDLGDDAGFLDGATHWTRGSTVPLASIFVRGTIASDHFEDTDSVGISTITPAALTTIGCVLIFVAFTWYLAKKRGVPGGGLLRIISTPGGVASLSQFQIMLWTTVIGGGVIYVMLISGNLIDIPAQTLGLLGISGIALIGAKATSGSDGSPQRIAAPGGVTDLNVVGTPASDSLVLRWNPPSGEQPPFTYTVRRRKKGDANWIDQERGLTAPPYAVLGLAADTSYDFEVFAINESGQGPAAILTDAKTATGGAQAPGAPGQVQKIEVSRSEQAKNDRPQARGRFSITWTRLAGTAAVTYRVQYRKAGTLTWQTLRETSEAMLEIATDDAKFDPGITYEFQVIAVIGNLPGPPSASAIARTPVRTPLLSDLIVNSPGDGREIDLARLQMLAFTSIAATFAAITLIDYGTIPDIPIGIVGLIGVSNGVYLGAKVVGK